MIRKKRKQQTHHFKTQNLITNHFALRVTKYLGKNNREKLDITQQVYNFNTY